MENGGSGMKEHLVLQLLMTLTNPPYILVIARCRVQLRYIAL